MELRYLGGTGLRVSALGLGTLAFGGRGDFFRDVGSIQAEEATAFVDRGLDAGVNLFDTADVYSAGRAEELLGQALRRRRDRVLIATKVHGWIGGGPNDLGQSRRHIMRACEASLRRLGTDWIDIYQVHAYDGRTMLEDTLGALDDLIHAGKVRYTGCSNYSAWHLMKALAASDRRGLARYVCLQAYYNLVARELEHELVPLCLDQNVGLLVFSPLAGGFLSGKFRPGRPDPPGTRRVAWGDPGVIDLHQGHDIVATLEEIARARDATVPQVALAWLLHRPGITSVIIGARDSAQLTENLAAAKLHLGEDERQRLDDVSGRPLPYPYWHQRQFNESRMPHAADCFHGM